MSAALKVAITFAWCFFFAASGAAEKLQVETVNVPGADGTIVGTYTRPLGEGPHPAVLILHGMGGNRHGSRGLYAKTARYFAEYGIASLRISTGGKGGSDGDFRDMTLDRRTDEAVAAFNWLTTRPDIAPRNISLLGHSQGSYVASATAARLTSSANQSGILPSALILWAPNADPKKSYIRAMGAYTFERGLKAGDGETISWRGAGRQRREFRRGFFESVQRADHRAKVKAFPGPLLVIAGARDRWSLSRDAQKLAEHHRGKHKFLQIDTGHRMGSAGPGVPEATIRTLAWLQGGMTNP